MGLLPLLWFLLVPLPVILGIYLVWKQTGILRILGWLILLLLVYYRLSWVSPWFVIRGGELVQEFKLNDLPFGPSPSVRWMESSKRLILVPDEQVVFIPEPPEYNHVLVVDLEARKSHWQPKAEVNLDETIPVKYLPTNPSELEIQSEFTFVGFSLPILVYNVPWPFFGGAFRWQWEKTYFGWTREIVRESKSGSGVVVNQMVLNAPGWLAGASSRSVMAGRFLVFEPELLTSRRVLVLGPFKASQVAQFLNNKRKQ